MARCLAAEWARHGIRVNTISPGYMDTVLNEGDGLEVHRRVWCERTPLGRMGTREELNGAVILLCSEAGSFITGTDIRVDGEFFASWPSWVCSECLSEENERGWLHGVARDFIGVCGILTIRRRNIGYVKERGLGVVESVRVDVGLLALPNPRGG